MSGQIIVVNGTSGSGKSTTCEMFARKSDDYWLRYGIDQFIAQTLPAKFGHHGPHSRDGIHANPVDPEKPDGPLRWVFAENAIAAFHAFHEWMASVARNGGNIIFDHLLMSDPPFLQDCIWRMEGLPVLLVTLKPPFEVLERRVAERPMGMPGAMKEEQRAKIVERLDRLRPWFYQAVYANDVTDLEIDTSAHGPEEVCAMIGTRLAQGPGTAFATLRERWPRPSSEIENLSR